MTPPSRLAFVFALAWWLAPNPARAAIPPTVPLAAAPPPDAPRGFPVCHGGSTRGLPLRADFERAHVPFQAEALRAATLEREAASFRKLESRPYSEWPNVKEFSGPLDRRTVITRSDGEGHSWWAHMYARPGRILAPSLLTFIVQYRSMLGFGPGETPLVLGQRIHKQYPNGARSVGYLVAKAPITDRYFANGCFSDNRSRGPGFDSTLPAPGDALGDPPDLTGPEALARFHDMNPYLTIESLDQTGPRLATRLVVVSTRTMASRLAWEIRYSYPCWDTGLGAKEPKQSRDTTFAYIDARSGVLVFGRDSERQGGTSPEVPVAGVTAGLGKVLASPQ